MDTYYYEPRTMLLIPRHSLGNQTNKKTITHTTMNDLKQETGNDVVTASFLAGPSEFAEEVFALLKEDGIKATNHAPLLERTGVNMDLMFHHSANQKSLLSLLLSQDKTAVKIGVYVDIKVARDKDQKLPHRVQLSEQVRDIVQEELQSKFGDSNSSGSQEPKLLLCVRLVLLSDGSSSGRRYTSAHGKAKLTLAYALQDVSTGQVGLANQLFMESQDDNDGSTTVAVDLDNYWEYSSAVVRSMARQLAKDIGQEVSNELEAWKLQYKANQERLELIQAKLAQEEFLEPDEYAFASQQHVL